MVEDPKETVEYKVREAGIYISCARGGLHARRRGAFISGATSYLIRAAELLPKDVGALQDEASVAGLVARATQCLLNATVIGGTSARLRNQRLKAAAGFIQRASAGLPKVPVACEQLDGSVTWSFRDE